MELEDVWQEYRGRVRAFLQSRISNPADVDDVLQEISLKTLHGLGSLKDTSRIQPWLFSIARNAVIDHYRGRPSDTGLHPDDLWHGDVEASVRQELAGCVQPFIAGLPEDHARVLTAIDIEGRSQKVYAEENGLAYSTLKSRVKAARTALRARFENCCRVSMDVRGNLADYRLKSGSCETC